ncbi:MAG: hypothetical protein IMY72_04125 [Bacteroidetes bacterium]|nr:hypothetical protein [Bacteroidota bacterium]
MERWKPLNMELRSWVISNALRLEQTSSSALRVILRMFKTDSKTLGNQSSALSFKSKIDLLLDLEEIDKKEYSHLLKIMEIRNQFAHNPNAVSFLELDNINPDINKYLLKHSPDDLKGEEKSEQKLKAIFSELFKQTAGKLLSIEVDYTQGIQKQMRQHINDSVVENIEEIWQSALERNKQNKAETPRLLLMSGDETKLERFYSDFKISLSEYKIGEVDKLEGQEATIFKQKETFEERLKKK